MPPTNRRSFLAAAGMGAATLLLLGLVWAVLVRLDSPNRIPVERLEVAMLSGVTGVLSREDAEKLFRDQVMQSGQFELLTTPSAGSNKSAEGSVRFRLSLELAVRRAPDSPENEDESESIADVTLSRRQEGMTDRYLCSGRGRARGPTAARDAASSALTEALVYAAAQARALDKSDGALKREARSDQPPERLAAITVLAERGHPSAANFLLEQLKLQDASLVRRAVGGLVRLREKRAVPAIIELSRGKPLEFQREMLFALAEIGGEEAEAYLFTVAEGHDDKGLQQAAQQALDELGRRKEREHP